MDETGILSEKRRTVLDISERSLIYNLPVGCGLEPVNPGK
jgi:hypothetical protein